MVDENLGRGVTEVVPGMSIQTGPSNPLGALGEGVMQGMKLAQMQENIKANREQLKMKQDEVKTNALYRFTEGLTNLKKAGGAGKALTEKFIRANAGLIGVDDPSGFISMAQSNDEQYTKDLAKANEMAKDIADNKKSLSQEFYAQINKVAGDPSEAPKFASEMVKDYEARRKNEELEKYRDEQVKINTAREGRLTGQSDIKNIGDVQREFQKDEAVKITEKSLASVNTAKGLIAEVRKGNASAAEPLKTQIARMSSETGPLSDYDTKRYGGSQALIARLEQYAAKALEGTLTPENLKDLEDITDTFEAAGKHNIEQQMRVYAARGALRLNMTEDDVYAKLAPEKTLGRFKEKKEDMVQMLNPAGKLVNIKASQQEQALKSNYKLPGK